MNIRLICTDCDDTLLPESHSDLNPEYFEVIRKLQEKGIRFVIASGRQKPSIKNTFRAMEDELIYLADNGTDITAPDYVDSYPFPEADYKELVDDLRSFYPTYEFMACKADCSYWDQNQQDMYTHMTGVYGYEGEMLADVKNVPGICKISLYRPQGIEDEVAEFFISKWKAKMDVCLAGDLFLDFMPKGANKGWGLQKLQEHYGIKKEETMAFGNAPNDIEMIRQAEYGYAVGNAHPLLKEAAYQVIAPMSEDGVLLKLKELLENTE